MGKSRSFDRRCRLVARFREGRLWLSPDVRRVIVAATAHAGPADPAGLAAVPAAGFFGPAAVPAAPVAAVAGSVSPAALRAAAAATTGPAGPAGSVSPVAFPAAAISGLTRSVGTAVVSTAAVSGPAGSMGPAAAIAAVARRIRLGGFGLSADRRAFARSIACERLADLYLLLDSPAAAFRCLEAAALASLCGEAYDHGEVSLPSRFLRIRFCRLFARMLACRASDPRLRRLPIDRFLRSEARRMDAGSL